MTQTSTYDRIVHTLGLAALALMGATQAYPKAIPVWLVIVAIVVAGIAQTSTMPLAARPDSIIKAAKSAGGSVLPNLLVFVALGGLLTAAMGIAGCPPSATPGVKPTPVQTFDACSDNVVQGKAISILGVVATAVATDGYVAALATLSVQYGPAELTCAVQLFIATMERKAALDATAMLQRERAQMWLAQHAPGDGGT